MELHVEIKEPSTWEFPSVDYALIVLFGNDAKLTCQALTPTSKSCGIPLSGKKISSLRKLLSKPSTPKVSSSELIGLLPKLAEHAICRFNHESTLNYEAQIERVRRRWLQAIDDACAFSSRPTTLLQPMIEGSREQRSELCDIVQKTAFDLDEIHCKPRQTNILGDGPFAPSLPLRPRRDLLGIEQLGQEHKRHAADNNIPSCESDNKNRSLQHVSEEHLDEEIQLRPALHRHDAMSTVVKQARQIKGKNLGHVQLTDLREEREYNEALSLSSPESETSDVFTPPDMPTQSSLATQPSPLIDESTWRFENEATPSQRRRPRGNSNHQISSNDVLDVRNDSLDSDDESLIERAPRSLVRKLWPIKRTGNLDLESGTFEPRPLARIQTVPVQRSAREVINIEGGWIPRRHSFHSLIDFNESEQDKDEWRARRPPLRRRDSFSDHLPANQSVYRKEQSSDIVEHDEKHDEEHKDDRCLISKATELGGNTTPVFVPYRNSKKEPPLASLLNKILDRVSHDDIYMSGSIYCYTLDNVQGYVKIGYAAHQYLDSEAKGAEAAVNSRLRYWKKCGYPLQLRFHAVVPNFLRKIESLIHAHLLQFRCELKCPTCGLGELKRAHDEWFKLDIHAAKEAVSLWQRFSYLTPYGLNTSTLGNLWADRAYQRSRECWEAKKKRKQKQKSQPSTAYTEEMQTWIKLMQGWIADEFAKGCPGDAVHPNLTHAVVLEISYPM